MKTNPEEARYLAELILSIIGVVILLALALYLINKSRKKDEVKPEVKQVLQPKAHKLIEPFTSSTRNPLNATEKSKIKISLSDAFLNWQKEHILTSEDGKSLFVREGVEKSGLRYQLLATTQTQAMAMLITTLLADLDTKASDKTEALFASLLAHPAYGEPNLSSWKFMPDLPRSPRLETNLQAEGWVLIALLTARRCWPDLDRFKYDEILSERLKALFEAFQRPEYLEVLAQYAFLFGFLSKYDRSQDWASLKNLANSAEQAFPEPEELKAFAFAHLNLGLDALLFQDDTSIKLLSDKQTVLRDIVERWLDDDFLSENAEGLSRLSLLACMAPALIVLGEDKLLGRVQDFLIDSNADKNDGLGATLKIFALFLLSN